MVNKIAEKRKKNPIDDQGVGIRKRRCGEGPFERFDVQVRVLCFDLFQQNNHVIFSALGVLDLIVEFARPIIPLFAKIPDVLLEAMDAMEPLEARINKGPYLPHINLDLSWRLKSSTYSPRDIPVGSVFSCPSIGGGPNECVDCIVVVPASKCIPKVSAPVGAALTTALGRQLMANNMLTNVEQWVVGVIIPSATRHKSSLKRQGTTVRLSESSSIDCQYTFGADRTIFLNELDNSLQAGAGAGAGWSSLNTPLNGWYAVHYVDVHCRKQSYWDPVLKRFMIVRPEKFNTSCATVYRPNSVGDLFPNYQHSSKLTQRIHLLPNEIPYWNIEANRLLSN